jgi:acetoin utilization deacetylase AcuC-like enzyme
MNLTLFHDPGFAAPIGKHIMPIRKFSLVADELRTHPGVEIRAPEPVTIEDLLRVHTPEYVEAVRTGEPRALAESQKFPWSPALFPSVLLTSGGVVAAGREALKCGVSGTLASGFHHACADHGEGFCTFNGLVVALEKLRAEGVIRTAAVLDLDLHYGNGTASLAATRPWLRALSLYGNDYAANVPHRDVTTRHHKDGPNHLSVPLIPGPKDGENLLALLDTHLPWLLAGGRPDLLLFQAGADPFHEDPYSPLNLNHDDLFARDRRVFSFAREHNLPVAWVLAGGYTEDIRQVVKVHVNTALACLEVYNFS